MLFDYGLFDKICDKIKYLISKKAVLQIVLIIILKRWKLIHIILCLLKRFWLLTMLLYSLSKLLIRMEINTTLMFF